MFEKSSTLEKLRRTLANHVSESEYSLGIQAYYDGEVIFSRDIVHLNLEMPPFPIDFSSAWKWFTDSLQGTPFQETFVYELPFQPMDEEDADAELLLALCRGSSMTVWLVDLAIDEGPEPDKRFVVITIPKKQEIAAFKRDYHGKDARGLLDAAAAQR